MKKQKEEIKNSRYNFTPVAYEYFIKSIRNENALDVLKKRYESAVDFIVKIINYGIKEKEFKESIDAFEVSKYIISFIEGLVITSISIGIDESSLKFQLCLFSESLEGFLIDSKIMTK